MQIKPFLLIILFFTLFMNNNVSASYCPKKITAFENGIAAKAYSKILLEIYQHLGCSAEIVFLPPKRGIVEFNNVTFGYDSANPVIHNLSLKVEPGETVAIVGATGSGKSTLVNLLERMYDPDQGAILLEGHDIRELDLQWLRNTVGLVMQEVYVIPGSIRENILLDREMDESELKVILKQAQLIELISRLPEGVHTKIGEGNLDLSAGQRQLLAMARVMARNPEILVLDEATSNVDSETEILVERAVEATLAQRTSIVIAHRLSTIRRSDRIIVMDSGRIIEEGTHENLMAGKGFYHRLQNLQYIEWNQTKSVQPSTE